MWLYIFMFWLRIYVRKEKEDNEDKHLRNRTCVYKDQQGTWCYKSKGGGSGINIMEQNVAMLAKPVEKALVDSFFFFFYSGNCTFPQK